MNPLILLIVVINILSFPISHIIMKKAMLLDYSLPLDEKKYKKLSKFFYIPIVNLIVYTSYLIYNIFRFKRN
jgi:hypothetical protein